MRATRSSTTPSSEPVRSYAARCRLAAEYDVERKFRENRLYTVAHSVDYPFEFSNAQLLVYGHANNALPQRRRLREIRRRQARMRNPPEVQCGDTVPGQPEQQFILLIRLDREGEGGCALGRECEGSRDEVL